jgi:hypothetical protein
MNQYSIDGPDETHYPNNIAHLEQHLISTIGLGSEEACNLTQTML